MNEINKLNNDIKIEDVAKSPIDYYPSKEDMSSFATIMGQMGLSKPRPKSIVPGYIARTDGFNVDESIKNLYDVIDKMKADKQYKDAQNITNLLSRIMSVSDLTAQLYEHFSENPNSLPNWYPQLVDAIDKSGANLFVPKTKSVRLPIELAQFIRIEYADTSQGDKNLFNEWVFKNLELEEDKTYFIKTGTFSSKFQFWNAKCREPLEMGEYFQVINNYAMEVGAGQSVDIVAREYIEDPEDNLTMYNGMPLRTEFRLFVDFDKKELIGSTPYWNPMVVRRVLAAGLSPSAQDDYKNYMAMEDKLMNDYNEHLDAVRNEVLKVVESLNGLTGKYSLDIMKSGDKYYAIDMAIMSESALKELLPLDVQYAHREQYEYEDQVSIVRAYNEANMNKIENKE